MPRPISEICAAIDAFRPVDGNWLPLDDLIAESLDHPEASAVFPTLLAVFARFPDDDGSGVFWSIVHGMEAFPDYEPSLLDAIRDCPTKLSLTMLNRMLNAGQTHVGDVSLLALLQSVSKNDAYSDNTRETAARFAERHSA